MMVFLLATTGLYAQQAGLWTFGIRGGASPINFNSVSSSAAEASFRSWWNTPVSGGWSGAADPGTLRSVSTTSTTAVDAGLGPTNVALYVAYTFMDNHSLQIELNLNAFRRWGGMRGWAAVTVVEERTTTGSSGLPTTTTSTQTWAVGVWYGGSLDIPILLRYGLFNGLLGVMAGPHISFVPAPIFGSGGAIWSRDWDYWDAGSGSRSSPGMRNRVLFGATAGIFGLIPAGPGRIVADLRFVFDFNAMQIQVAGNSYNIMRRRVPIISLGYELSF